MKKKIAAFAAYVAAVIASLGTLYGMCKFYWACAVEEYERINWSAPCDRNLVWKYGDFQSYLFQKASHYIALVFLLVVFILVFRGIFEYFLSKRIEYWEKAIEELLREKKKILVTNEESENEILRLNRRLDKTPPGDDSTMRQLLLNRRNRLYREVAEKKLQLHHMDYMIRIYNEKIVALEKWL